MIDVWKDLLVAFARCLKMKKLLSYRWRKQAVGRKHMEDGTHPDDPLQKSDVG